MMEEKDILIRHGVPGSLDFAETGTYCKVVNSNSKSFDLWIQCGPEDMPAWQYVDSFPNKTHELTETLDLINNDVD